MKTVYSDKSNCCGCASCSSICHKKAIHMEYDDCGFSYPIIDDKCVDCGLCKKVCSFSQKNNYPKFKNCIVFKHESENVVNESRSGGFFTAISDYVLENGGVIYGAYLDNNFFVKHIRATNKQERDLLRKSKYVQSNLEGIVLEIANDLKKGLKVLFTGTGCQCDSIKQYLKTTHIPTDNLIICDIVCHSNASPILFKKYIDYQSKKYNTSIKEYYFRDKRKFSWFSHVEKIVFDNDKTIYTDEYTNLYYSDDIRPSCYNCKYTSLNRCGDFTISDCWGGQVLFPQIVNKTGASLVFINNEKAEKLFNLIKKNNFASNIDIKDVMQPRLSEPVKKSDRYEEFWNDYRNLDFSIFIKKYSKNNYSLKMIFIKKLIMIFKFPLKIIRRIMRTIYD